MNENNKIKKATYVCFECGTKYGKIPNDFEVTNHIDYCDICGQLASLCHIRNYNYLRKE